MRLVVLHAAIVYVPARVIATLALGGGLAAAAGIPTPIAMGAEAFVGVRVAVAVVVGTTIVAAIDRRRVGAPILLANLGMSRGMTMAASAIPAIIGEALLNVLLAR